jgi:hypothetical protein
MIFAFEAESRAIVVALPAVRQRDWCPPG